MPPKNKLGVTKLLRIGMEDALVKAFQPAWNGSDNKFLTESEAIEESAKKSA